MINVIWMILMASGIIYAGMNGKIELVTASAINAAKDAVELSLNLIGVMCLWLGIMKIAELSGLIKAISYLLNPIVGLLFPRVPKNHPAMGAIIMTISANLLGLGNAVTPLGIKAMQQLQTLNPKKDTATPAMCTLLALCTTGFTLVPATIIAIRSAAGSTNPTAIVGATIIVSLFATIFVLCVDRICQLLSRR
ncbi:nucleoside recognition domain-containing protein [Sporomusa acidovorans]|uniref:Spore maturation protein A n=1 Tax=Sporomusa acidovorans (strain ATCC 49682 / DSM 3132 / Mol) TaxID=1123286 RepID=A0ABZ3J3Q5_SPOA4|nr:nucleoside recognition domain-containing protein [Sporomusa acidovorans]OZC20320.1 spore maturation protein A [Sporomusa acidovorans DSM 3132]SDD37778.1 spore maturation protein A [Sporomusa acidovorans]